LNLFSEWDNKTTFIRWRKTTELGTTLLLEPNMVMRLNNTACVNYYAIYDGMKNEPPSLISMLKKINAMMEGTEALSYKGPLDEQLSSLVDTIKNKTVSQISSRIDGPPRLEVGYTARSESRGGGGITYRKKKQLNKRTDKKRKKKRQRTEKKRRRTHRKIKKSYNP